jgi:hypothetical protein
LVRGVAVWALGRLAPQRLIGVAAALRAREQDASALKEWELALAAAAA